MSTSTVTSIVLDPSANPVAGALVRVTLISSATDQNQPGYGPTGTIGAPESTTADTLGAWSLPLVPNGEITPANTYYQVSEAGKISNIVVPAGGGPYTLKTLLVTPPPTPSASGITGVQIALDGTVAGVRPELNVITGAGGILSIADNPGANRVDLTIGSASGSGSVPTTRQINTTAPLAGGGDLSADRTLSITADGIDATLLAAGLKSPAAGVEGLRTLGTSSTSAAAGNDPRLSDARTPTAHAASHAAAGSDPVTIAESQVTNLVADLAALAASLAVKAPLASPTFTGTVTEAAVTRTGRTLRTYTVLTDAATIAVDASLGDHVTVTLGGNPPWATRPTRPAPARTRCCSSPSARTQPAAGR